MLVPMLDEAIELAAARGAHEVVIGMAHRGRLNALVHTVGRSYESVLREFEGERSYDALVVDPEGGSGDVKYHLPASGTRVAAGGEIGARRIVSMFREEVDLAMGFLGIKSLAELGPDFLWFDGLAAGRALAPSDNR